MTELYHVEGTVNEGFVGQITYTVCLDKPCTELDIHFTYDYAELRYRDEEITPELLKQTQESVAIMCGHEIDEARARNILTKEIDMKTEIHPLAMLNDEFIGCIHRQQPDRHMLYQGEYATEGCIPQKKFEGVLKITLLVFNVVKDNTHYTLTVSGK